MNDTRHESWSREILGRGMGWLISGLLIFAVFGCGGGKQPAPVEKPPEKTPAEIAAEKEKIRLDTIKKQLLRARERIRDNPDAFEAHIMNLDGLVRSAEGTPYEEETKDLLQRTKEGFEKLAVDQLQPLLEKSDQHLEEGDYPGAEAALSDYDIDRFMKTKAIDGLRSQLEKIELYQQAEIEFDNVLAAAETARFNNELPRAIGILVSYPEAYLAISPPRQAKLQEMIDEIYVEYTKEKEAKEAVKEIPFQDLGVDEYLSEFGTRGDKVWKGVEDVVEGNNETDRPAQLVVGEDSWEEWILLFDIKVDSGQELKLGITSGNVPGRQQRQYDGHRVTLDTDDWVTLRVSVVDGIVTVLDTETTEKLVDAIPNFPAGGFAVILFPEEKVLLRNFKYKLIKKAGQSPEEEED